MPLDGADNKFVGRDVTIIKHRAHPTMADCFCVEVEHPDLPENIVLVRAAALSNIRSARP